MIKFKKDYNYKVIPITVGFLFNSLLSAVLMSSQKETLRVPLNNLKRVEEALFAVTRNKFNLKTSSDIRKAYFEHYGNRIHRIISRRRMIDERFSDVFVRSADPEWFYLELRKYVATQGFYIPESQLACTVQPSDRHGNRASSINSLQHLRLFEMATVWYIEEDVNPERVFRDILTFLESCGLERSKLQITVLRRDEIKNSLHFPTLDVYNAWLRAGILPEQIIFKGSEDNLGLKEELVLLIFVK